MTFDEIMDTLKNVNRLNGLELYTRSEQVNNILAFNNGGLSNSEFNLLRATKLMIEDELDKRGDYDG
jgi:hypothetical protein